MLNAIIIDTLWDETPSISAIMKEAYVRRELPVKRMSIVRELPSLLKASDESVLDNCNLFMASFDENAKQYTEFAQHLRRRRESVFIVFLLNSKSDVSACVRPSIRPSGILFIPPEKMLVYQTVREIYLEHMRIDERDKQPAFVIKSGSDYYSLNTGDISFFEAQGKKIAVKTRGQEILFYSNFDTVLEQLPGHFIRCHKGFVVNTKQIGHINFTEMAITLTDKSIIPFSRTYRDILKSIWT
ncbi:MAG TPA: LytTR family DNA-binding domain-containing protein [Anaerovoracaceae bacterium]|nr:LytTR family DNA-binding domain-containing protein [Anaerovoracaceae bacterium]